MIYETDKVFNQVVKVFPVEYEVITNKVNENKVNENKVIENKYK